MWSHDVLWVLVSLPDVDTSLLGLCCLQFPLGQALEPNVHIITTFSGPHSLCSEAQEPLNLFQNFQDFMDCVREKDFSLFCGSVFIIGWFLMSGDSSVFSKADL